MGWGEKGEIFFTEEYQLINGDRKIKIENHHLKTTILINWLDQESPVDANTTGWKITKE